MFLTEVIDSVVKYTMTLKKDGITRGELSYLAPLGSENISAPYFKQCFFRGGSITPQTVKHHASQSQYVASHGPTF